jgi:hypothetical protein
MPINYWTSGSSSNWEISSNWSLGVVPTLNDVATFGISGDGACTLGASVSAGGVDLTLYNATLDFSSNNLTCIGAFTVGPSASCFVTGTGSLNISGGPIRFMKSLTSVPFGPKVTLIGDTVILVDGVMSPSNYSSTVIVEMSQPLESSISGSYDLIYGQLNGNNTYGGILRLLSANRFLNSYSYPQHKDTYIYSGKIGEYIKPSTTPITASREYWFGTGKITTNGGFIQNRANASTTGIRLTLNNQIDTYDGGFEDGEAGASSNACVSDISGNINLFSKFVFSGENNPNTSAGRSNVYGKVILKNNGLSKTFMSPSTRQFRQISFMNKLTPELPNDGPLILINDSRREFFFGFDTDIAKSDINGLILTRNGHVSHSDFSNGLVIFGDVYGSTALGTSPLGIGDVTISGSCFRIAQDTDLPISGSLNFYPHTFGFSKISNGPGGPFAKVKVANSVNIYGNTQFGGTGIGTINSFITSAQDNPDRDLVFYYRLNQTSGTVATDSSNESQTGTITGSVSYNVVGVDLNGGFATPVIQFNGGNSGVIVPNGTKISNQTNTRKFFSAVICPSDVSGRKFIYEQGNENTGFNIYIENGFLKSGVWNTISGIITGSYLTSSSPISADNIYVTCLKYDGASTTREHKLFINGDLSAIQTNQNLIPYQLNAVTSSLNGIGFINGATRLDNSTTITGDNNFVGNISEVCCWNSARTDNLSRHLRDVLINNVGETLTTIETSATNWYAGHFTIGTGTSANIRIENINITGNVSINSSNLLLSTNKITNISNQPAIFSSSANTLHIADRTSNNIGFFGTNNDLILDLVSSSMIECFPHKNNSIISFNNTRCAGGQLIIYDGHGDKFGIDDQIINATLSGNKDLFFDEVVIYNRKNSFNFKTDNINIESNYLKFYQNSQIITRDYPPRSGSLNINLKDSQLSATSEIIFSTNVFVSGAPKFFKMNLDNSELSCLDFRIHNTFDIYSYSNISAGIYLSNSKIKLGSKGHGNYLDLASVDQISYDENSCFEIISYPYNTNSFEIYGRSNILSENLNKQIPDYKFNLGADVRDKDFDMPLNNGGPLGSPGNPFKLSSGTSGSYNLLTDVQNISASNDSGYLFYQINANAGDYIEILPDTFDSVMIVYDDSSFKRGLIYSSDDTNNDYAATFKVPATRTYYVKITNYATKFTQSIGSVINQNFDVRVGLPYIDDDLPIPGDLVTYTGYNYDYNNLKYKSLNINKNASFNLMLSVADDPEIDILTINESENIRVDGTENRIYVNSEFILNDSLSASPILNLNLSTNLNNSVQQYVDLNNINCENHKLNVVRVRNKGNNTNINFRRPW